MGRAERLIFLVHKFKVSSNLYCFVYFIWNKSHFCFAIILTQLFESHFVLQFFSLPFQIGNLSTNYFFLHFLLKADVASSSLVMCNCLSFICLFIFHEFHLHFEYLFSFVACLFPSFLSFIGSQTVDHVIILLQNYECQDYRYVLTCTAKQYPSHHRENILNENTKYSCFRGYQLLILHQFSLHRNKTLFQ